MAALKLKNDVILRRQGCKGKLAGALLQAFPSDIVTFVDLFAGTLSVSLSMLRSNRCQYAICNDIDGEVVNLWEVLRDRRADLEYALLITPSHAEIFLQFKQAVPADPIWRAVRLLYLSNFSFMGCNETMRIAGRGHDREILRERLKQLCSDDFDRMQFISCDFREALGKVALRTYTTDPRRGTDERQTAFLYADPPYLGREGNGYRGFNEQDLRDLLAVCAGSGLRFALSEFDSQEVRNIVADYPSLTVTPIGERRNLNNRATEILITNYAVEAAQPSLFD